MHKILPAAAALAVAFALPSAVEAQNNGRGNGGDHAEGKGHGRDNGRGGPQRQDGDGDRGRSDDARGRGQGRADRDIRPAPQAVREVARGPQARNEERGRGPGRDERQEVRRDDRLSERVIAARAAATFRADRDRGLIDGCPPGLAKRNNGCLPPGQERKIARAQYNWLWDRDRDVDWRYDDGYLYKMGANGSVAGWLPVLGGALAPGAVWPQQYAYQPAPQYYADYFRLNDPYDYRYANGALYGVDPQTQAITSVVALLTGQPINVGQPMPAGYDVYNVPYAYRDRYVDTADSWYRYNDGYVYQVDPTTRLVQAVIQLLV